MRCSTQCCFAEPARFYAPGTDLAEIFPAVARQREAEEAAAAAEIAELHELLALRDELMQIKAELARRRLADAKYSPSQPRVPAGNPRGGQWTDRGGQSQGTGLTLPMGNVDAGDLSESSEAGDLFQIAPSDTSVDGEQVADVIRVCTVIGAGRGTVDGVKTYSVIYECFGGRIFRVEGLGHNFPGVVLDRFR